MEKTSTSITAGKRTNTKAPDAIAILTADHDKVRKLFKQYDSVKASADSDEKSALAATICAELTVHAQAEEEIFYPAVRESIPAGDMIDEATVEHASAKDLIAQIEDSDPDDEMFDAKVKVLGEYIEHHVKEEEGEMFAKARKAKLDLAALGVEIAERKEELMADLADEDQEPTDKSSKQSNAR